MNMEFRKVVAMLIYLNLALGGVLGVLVVVREVHNLVAIVEILVAYLLGGEVALVEYALHL